MKQSVKIALITLTAIFVIALIAIGSYLAYKYTKGSSKGAITISTTVSVSNTDIGILSNYNGPLFLNGDPTLTPSNTFNKYKSVRLPYSSSTFAQITTCHKFGFIAASAYDSSTNSSQLYIFEIDKDGDVKIHNFFTLDNTNIRSLCFADVLNMPNEIYYLFVGVNNIDNGNTYAPTKVLVYTYDTNSSHANAYKWSPTSRNIDHPCRVSGTCEANPDPTNLHNWASFGDTMKCITKNFIQYIFIRGSQYESEEPGGCIFWYSFNQAIVPEFTLLFKIKDVKLTQIFNSGIRSTANLTDALLANSFGTSFDVDMTDATKCLLIVSNPSGEDSHTIGSNPESFQGYIQIYTLNINDTKGTWSQDLTESSNIYKYRLRFDMIDPSYKFQPGFAYSVKYYKGNIIFSNSTNSNFYMLPIPLNDKNGWAFASKLKPTTLSTDSLKGASVYPDGTGTWNTYPFNKNIVNIPLDDKILISNPSKDTGDVIRIFNTTIDGGQIAFNTSQNIGVDVNSNDGKLPTNWHDGFGQYINSWFSQSGGTIFMVINDPDIPEQITKYSRGRILVYMKTPNS